MAKTAYKVPFKEGRFQNWTSNNENSRYANEYGIEWRENTPWIAIVSFQGMRRGMSAAQILVKDITNDMDYSMFMTDVLDVLQRAAIKDGITVPMRWEIKKRGANFGLGLTKEQ